MKNKSFMAFMMLVACTTHYDANSMFNTGKNFFWRHKGKIAIGAAVAYGEYKNRKKKHFIYDIAHNNIQAITDDIQAISIEDCGSPTAKHIAAYHRWQYPEQYSEFYHEHVCDADPTLEEMIEDIVYDKYREAPFIGFPLARKQRESLKQTVLYLIHQEQIHADTHYVLYHGTYSFPALIFRTIMADTFTDRQDAPSLLLFRKKGQNNKLEHINNAAQYMHETWNAYSKDVEKGKTVVHDFILPCGNSNPRKFMLSGPDDLPDMQQAFISTNIAAMGNTNSFAGNGENSLTFISTIPTGIDQGGPLGKYPHILWHYLSLLIYTVSHCIDPHATPFLDFDKKMTGGNIEQIIDTISMHATQNQAYEYMYEFSYLGHSAQFGALVQLFIPKERIDCAYACYGWGRNAGKPIQELLENMQTSRDDVSQFVSQYSEPGEVIDCYQARILLKPSLFEDQESGIDMNIIGFGNKKEFKLLIRRMNEIANTLYEETKE